jgi:hypothetical protein
MKIKLKKHLQNELLWIPQTKSAIVGKFISPNLFPILQKKYPDWFDVEVEKQIHEEITFEQALEEKIESVEPIIQLKSKIK